MPNMVAHIYFGKEVLKELPAEIKQICEKYLDAFLYGTIGPDFLFALREIGDPAKRYTNIMQTCRVYETFRSIAKRLCEVKDEREISYAMGLMCHYVADFNIHPYVWFFCEEGFVKDLELLDKPHVHGHIELAFDEYTARELIKDRWYKPAKDLRTSAKTNEAIANFYVGAVNKIVGLDVSKFKIKLAVKVTRFFARVAFDRTGIKKRIFKFLEEKVLHARKLTTSMRPPYGYGEIDYLNFSHKPFRKVRDMDETINLSFPELLEKSKEIAVDYAVKFYEAIKKDGDLEPMGGYEAFKINYEGVTNIKP
ncbi:MAG TPA: zinc dependent phospholipase C family protein [Clostridia bacterium]|jgi:hypothetical protein|nr:zinc dependent phospholipase C family protein [Clostridia bacterium]HOK82293.1 zinc dependent phospholipase C family protein [Clostridia bacterium]HOL61100.1 zinc dependent phospholipase C family protein [Clostridia bacterium]HPO53766.1 zinc dependent phospholipase C family protein [Clostridia bacterium]